MKRLPLTLDAQKLSRVVSFKGTSALAGKVADLALPRPVLQCMILAYSRVYDVDLTEAELAVGEFSSFGEFFSRKLVPGSRPVHAAPEFLVAPSDGKVACAGTVAGGTVTQVKGIDYELSALLGDPGQAAEFEGGSYVTVYLSPSNYHRVHSPCEGRLISARYIPGALYSVSPLPMRRMSGLLAANERVVLEIETDRGEKLALVMVAAVVVGRVRLNHTDLQTNVSSGEVEMERYDPALSLSRGQDLGAFTLGSTVVLVTQPGFRLHRVTDGMPVRMGVPLFERCR